MSTFDVLLGVIIGALICVASIYGPGYRITKR